MKWLYFTAILFAAAPISAQDPTLPGYNPVQAEKQRQMEAQVRDCENNFNKGVDTSSLSGIRSFLGGCRFSAVNEQDIIMSRIRGMGIDTPLYFANAEEARQRELDQRRMQGDQLIVTRNVVRFDQTVDPNPAVTSAGDVLGETGITLSGDVKEILLQLQDSISTREFIANPNNQQREGMNELLEFAWLWERIAASSANCGGTRVDANSGEVRDIMWNKPGRVLPPAQLFFGIKSEEDLAKLNAMKWEQGPYVRYLFNSTDGSFNENWVLAEYDKTTGEVRFTHFKTVRNERVETAGGGKTPDGISAAIPLNMTMMDGREQFGARGWIGASVQTSDSGLPWGQSVTLPTGVINLASVQINETGGDVRSSQTINATTRDVSITNTIVPNDTTSWDLQTRASLQTQTGDWRASAGVRVYNVMLGYDTNNGKSHSANMTVVDGNNYVKYDMNNSGSRRVSLGHMFDKKNGGVAYSFDSEQKSHRIEIVVLF